MHVVLINVFFFYSDKNECDEEDICGEGQYCVNNPGSFVCKGNVYDPLIVASLLSDFHFVDIQLFD